MTFGYCFSPSGPKLATGWNGLKPSWLNAFFFESFVFWRKIRNGVPSRRFFLASGVRFLQAFWLLPPDCWRVPPVCDRVSGSCLFS